MMFTCVLEKVLVVTAHIDCMNANAIQIHGILFGACEALGERRTQALQSPGIGYRTRASMPCDAQPTSFSELHLAYHA